MPRLSVVFAVSIGGLSVFAPALAEAHFMLNSPTSWWTQAADGTPQKWPRAGTKRRPASPPRRS